MPTIVILHRRDQSDAFASRLHDGLATTMPDTTIVTVLNVIDDATPVSQETLQNLVGDASVLLVVIGPLWLTLVDAQGQRLLDDQNDLVRLTIEMALTEKVATIPLLVEDTELPGLSQLPLAIGALSTCDPQVLRHVRWGLDLARLVSRIESTLADLQAAPRGFGTRLDRLRRRVVANSLRWRAIKRIVVTTIVIGASLALVGTYRYISGADLRRIQQLSETLSAATPVVDATAAMDSLKDLALRAQKPTITEAVAAKLKSVVLDDTDTEEAYAIRRKAIEALRAIRANNLTRDFQGQGLSGAELNTVDMESTNLRGVNLSNASLEGSNFRSADLRDADLSGAFVRNGDFTSAGLEGADITDLDWFNAAGFSEMQLRTVRANTRQRCPEDSSGQHSPQALQDLFIEEYTGPWEDYPLNERTQLTKLWQEYGKQGGLCELVDAIPR